MSEIELAAKLGVTRREISLRAEPSTRLIPPGAKVVWVSPKRYVALIESEWPRFNWPVPPQRAPPIEEPAEPEPAPDTPRRQARAPTVSLVEIERREALRPSTTRTKPRKLTAAERLAAVEAALKRAREGDV